MTPERWDSRPSPEEVRRRIQAMKDLLPATDRRRPQPPPQVSTPNEHDQPVAADPDDREEPAK